MHVWFTNYRVEGSSLNNDQPRSWVVVCGGFRRGFRGIQGKFGDNPQPLAENASLYCRVYSTHGANEFLIAHFIAVYATIQCFLKFATQSIQNAPHPLKVLTTPLINDPMSFCKLLFIFLSLHLNNNLNLVSNFIISTTLIDDKILDFISRKAANK